MDPGFQVENLTGVLGAPRVQSAVPSEKAAGSTPVGVGGVAKLRGAGTS